MADKLCNMFKINFNIEKIGLYLVLTPLVAYVIDMLTLIVGGKSLYLILCLPSGWYCWLWFTKNINGS